MGAFMAPSHRRWSNKTPSWNNLLYEQSLHCKTGKQGLASQLVPCTRCRVYDELDVGIRKLFITLVNVYHVARQAYA